MKTIQNFIGGIFAAALLFVSASPLQALPHTEPVEQKSDRTESGAQVVSDYHENVAITKKGEKYGLVNRQGYELCTPRFDEVRPMHQGFAAVRLGAQWSFVNKQGQVLGQLRFDWVTDFHNGFAAVQNQGKWGFINEQGFLICDLEYERVGTFDENGKAPVKYQGVWYSVDGNGNRSLRNHSVQAEEVQPDNVRY